MTTTTTQRPRPKSLRSSTTRLNTEFGKLYVTVAVDENDQPYEVFGIMGKGGSFQSGVTELVCRLISLHLRRGTTIAEIGPPVPGDPGDAAILQRDAGGASVPVLGIGDGIAHVLREYSGSERVSGRPSAVLAMAAP